MATLCENATVLGRKWLSAFPSTPLLTLSDHAIASNLMVRTLSQSEEVPTCALCARNNELGHSDVCLDAFRNVRRHDGIWDAIVDCLRNVEGLDVEKEPTIPLHEQIHNVGDQAPRRNDIRIKSLATRGFAAAEFNIKVGGLRAVSFCNWAGGGPRTADMMADVQVRLSKGFAAWQQKKINEFDLSPQSTINFHPLIFSAGGLMEEGTASTLQAWKAHLAPGAYSFMMSRISVGLAVNRALLLYDMI